MWWMSSSFKYTLIALIEVNKGMRRKEAINSWIITALQCHSLCIIIIFCNFLKQFSLFRCFICVWDILHEFRCKHFSINTFLPQYSSSTPPVSSFTRLCFCIYYAKYERLFFITCCVFFCCIFKKHNFWFCRLLCCLDKFESWVFCDV